MGRTDAVPPAPEEPRGFGPVMRWLLLGTVGGLALVALALVLIPGSRPGGGKPSTAATPAASPDPASPPGATMEVTGHALASTKALSPAAEQPAPDVQAPAPDVVDGLPLPKRQEIFLALSRMFAAAAQETLARYPIKKTFDGNMLEVTKQRYEQRKFSEDLMAKGRRELAERYKIDEAALERINQEGTEKKWPRE